MDFIERLYLVLEIFVADAICLAAEFTEKTGKKCKACKKTNQRSTREPFRNQLWIIQLTQPAFLKYNFHIFSGYRK